MVAKFSYIGLLTILLCSLTTNKCSEKSSGSPATIEEKWNKLLASGGMRNKRYLAATYADALEFPKLLPYDERNVIQSIKGGWRKVVFSASDNGSRRERRSVGTIVTQTCVESATASTGDTLNMCKICTALTSLPTDYFPQFINEVTCGVVNGSCFSQDGLCLPVSFTVVFLRANSNCGSACTIAGWEPVSIAVGCDCKCQLKSSSVFASFV